MNQSIPTVSLLVPVRNEANYIGYCVQSLLMQDYPPEAVEIIVIDGMSTDGSWEILQELAAANPRLKLLRNPKIIQSAAWNLGIQQSHGDLIGIVSGHSVLAQDYVSKAVEVLQRTGAHMVGGPVQAIGQTQLAKVISLATSTPFGMGDARFRYTKQEEEVDTVFMGLCQRKVYIELGGFDEELVRDQDDEFSYRLRKSGGKIVCSPDINSLYYNRPTFSSLWKQFYQYGFYKVRVLQKHPRQMRPRQFVPPLFAGGLLGSLLLSLLFPWGWIFLALAAGSYLAANLSAASLIASRSSWKFLAQLPLCFTILHLGYGLGFLLGLFKFWNRWGDKMGKVPNLQPSDVPNT